jgi:S-adenosylhomocysteine hydrolase|eukprot:COSAG06_NODE_1045_length_10977_cov_29.037323_10_plen_161_part_00
MSKKEECVKVVLRCRPMNSTEKEAGRKRVVDMNGDTGQIRLTNPAVNEPPKEFTFDGAYNWESRQADLYDGTCRAIVNQVMEGFNGTVFAYGQTGTGKTFSMEGVAGDPELKGVIPRCFEQIFDDIGAIDEKEFRASGSPPRCTAAPPHVYRCLPALVAE